MIGLNPAIPEIFSNILPKLEDHSSFDIVRANLNAMHAAGKELIKCESSDKISQALRSNICSSPNNSLCNGHTVFYKRNYVKEWHGLMALSRAP